MSQSIPGKPVFPALPLLSSQGSTHTTVARGTALWESLVGKPRWKASRASHRSLDPREGKGDTAASARTLSSRAVAAVSRFPSLGSRDLWLSLEACPRGFPTGLSHKPPWCESILGLKVVAVQGKQVSLEWTDTSGGLWEWWHDPGLPLALPVESPSS